MPPNFAVLHDPAVGTAGPVRRVRGVDKSVHPTRESLGGGDVIRGVKAEAILMRSLAPLGVRFAPGCLQRDGRNDKIKHPLDATCGHPKRM